MKTIIISAFPTTGKSYFFRRFKHVASDSDSSQFSNIIDEKGNKVKNPDFPNNYVNHIKSKIGKVPFIFVSTHKEIREALVQNGIEFECVVPFYRNKDEIHDRLIKRESPQWLIDVIMNNFEAFLDDINKNVDLVKIWKLDKDEYISTIISDIAYQNKVMLLNDKSVFKHKGIVNYLKQEARKNCKNGFDTLYYDNENLVFIDKDSTSFTVDIISQLEQKPNIV